MQKYLIRTYSGHLLDILNPDPDCIDINDIALALSNISRFTGHTDTGYSVAQHCINLSNCVAPEHALATLMHDAAETYIGDISIPLKSLLGNIIKGIEYHLLQTIFRKYNIPFPVPDFIKRLDHTFIDFEGSYFLSKWENQYKSSLMPYKLDFSFYPAKAIAVQFLYKFKKYKQFQETK